MHESHKDARVFSVKTKTGPRDWPVLICCHEDMCNYMDSLDISIQVSGATNANGSFKGTGTNDQNLTQRTKAESGLSRSNASGV